MAPQLLQDKALNANLAFEALHNPGPTAPSSLTSLMPPVAQPQPVWLAALALEFGFVPSVPSPLPSVPLLPGPLLSLDGYSLCTALPVASLAPPVHSQYGSQYDAY